MHSERSSGVVDDAATDDRPDGRVTSARQTVAARVDRLKVFSEALERLPVTLRFWDDSAVVARDPNAPVVSIRDQRAVAHFLRAPNELGLSRAWVSGALDADGDLERVLALRHRVSGLSLGPFAIVRGWRRPLCAWPALASLRRPPIPACEAEPAGRLHSLRRDRASVTHHYDVSNAFYRMLLGPSLVYSCAYFAEHKTRSRPPRSASSS